MEKKNIGLFEVSWHFLQIWEKKAIYFLPGRFFWKSAIFQRLRWHRGGNPGNWPFVRNFQQPGTPFAPLFLKKEELEDSFPELFFLKKGGRAELEIAGNWSISEAIFFETFPGPPPLLSKSRSNNQHPRKTSVGNCFLFAKPAREGCPERQTELHITTSWSVCIVKKVP